MAYKDGDLPMHGPLEISYISMDCSDITTNFVSHIYIKRMENRKMGNVQLLKKNHHKPSFKKYHIFKQLKEIDSVKSVDLGGNNFI